MVRMYSKTSLGSTRGRKINKNKNISNETSVRAYLDKSSR